MYSQHHENEGYEEHGWSKQCHNVGKERSRIPQTVSELCEDTEHRLIAERPAVGGGAALLAQVDDTRAETDGQVDSYTVRYAVNFLQNSHNRRPNGRAMGCLLLV